MSSDNEAVASDWPNATVEAEQYDLSQFEHLKSDDLNNVTRRIFSVHIDGTPTDLERKNPKGGPGVKWKFANAVHNNLRHVMSTMDRRAPNPDQLEGDLDRAVLLNVEIIEHSNTYAFPLDVDISALVPTTLSSNKASVWTIEPHTPPSMVNVNVFHPNTIINKSMFDRYERCDMEMLNREFIRQTGEKSDMMLMASDGVAAAILRGSPQSFPGIRFPDTSSRYMDVPKDIALQVYDYMKTKIQAVEKSFQSIKNIEARWSRSDGLPFNAGSNLIGDVAAAEPDKYKDYQNQVLNTYGRASIKVCVDYVLFPASTPAEK